MTYEQIESIMQKKNTTGPLFQINFKTRSPIKGLFIKTSDYKELSRKNLWRIVSETHLADYKKSANENLAKIFNGSDFTKLEVL